MDRWIGGMVDRWMVDRWIRWIGGMWIRWMWNVDRWKRWLLNTWLPGRTILSIIHEEIAYISSEAWLRLVSTFSESLRRRSPRCWQPMAGTDEIISVCSSAPVGCKDYHKIPSRAHGACQGCGSKPAADNQYGSLRS